jgi:hypothetical protein
MASKIMGHRPILLPASCDAGKNHYTYHGVGFRPKHSKKSKNIEKNPKNSKIIQFFQKNPIFPK